MVNNYYKNIIIFSCLLTIFAYSNELLKDWELARSGNTLIKIEPL
jgi:hypothetical protein